MKKIIKLCLLTMAITVLALPITDSNVNAVSNGSNATHQYGAVSLWFPDASGVNRHRCGASLISQYWAVTAAHCEAVLVPGKTQVKVGGLNNADATQYQDVGLAQVVKHPDYATLPGNQLANDIALIKFQSPVTKQTTKLALPLASPPLGSAGKVAGWGWICDDTVGQPGALPNCGLPYTNILQELTIKVVSDSHCGYMGIAQKELCAVAGDEKHAMACRGDSGTPFVQNILQFSVLTGVVLADGDAVIGHAGECDENSAGEQGTADLIDTAQYTEWIINTILGTLSNPTPSEKAAHTPQIVQQ